MSQQSARRCAVDRASRAQVTLDDLITSVGDELLLLEEKVCTTARGVNLWSLSPARWPSPWMALAPTSSRRKRVPRACRADFCRRTKVHTCRFCFNNRLAREPHLVVGRRTLTAQGELEDIRLEKEHLLASYRGMRSALVRPAKRPKAASLDLQLSLSDARALLADMQRLRARACRVAGIATGSLEGVVEDADAQEADAMDEEWNDDVQWDSAEV